MRFYSADYAPESQILLRFTLWIVHHKSSEWPGSRQKHSIFLQGTKTNFFLKSRKNIAYFFFKGSKAPDNYPFTHDDLQSLGRPKRGGYMNQSTHPSHAGDDEDEDEDEDEYEDEDEDDKSFQVI